MKPCTHPGCSALLKQGDAGSKCTKHAGDTYAAAVTKRAVRTSTASKAGTRYATTNARDALYNSAHWKRRRAFILLRDRFCCICRKARSTVVDHKIAREQGGDESDENLQGLCTACHSRKTIEHDRGFGRQQGETTYTRMQRMKRTGGIDYGD